MKLETKYSLKVSPWRKILKYRKRGKLSPRFTGPYEILERIGPVAYRLALPPELAKLHDVFHVSMLRKYCLDELHILPVQEVQVQHDLSYDEELKAIPAREVKQFQNKQVPLVKVFWQHHAWYGKSDMGTKINNEGTIASLFSSGKNFEGEILLRGGEL